MPALRISALFFAMLLASGLSGCGKTGPLYLPDEKVSYIDHNDQLLAEASRQHN